MKKGINYWSFPGSFADLVNPADAIKLANEHGYETLELCIGEPGTQFGTDVTEARCKELVAIAADNEIELSTTASGLYWGRSLGDPDAKVRAAAKDDLEKMLSISSWLGAKVHLTIPGAVDVFFMPDRPKQDYNDVMKWGADGIHALLPHAKSCGLTMGIENVWNKILLSPGEMAAFIDQFESEFVGVLFDVGNIIPFGYPEMWIRDLGKRIVAIHFKDFRRAVGNENGFVDLLEGDVNWPEVMNALAEIGYDRPVVAEMIPHYPNYPMVRVANTSRAMDAILGR
jgi:L-ribulose-5-phosphate 3-epimerase